MGEYTCKDWGGKRFPRPHKNITRKEKNYNFPGGPVIKTELPMQGCNLIPDQGTKIPCALWWVHKENKK